jgi:perosamine synthetase
VTVPAYPTLAGFRRTGRLHSNWQSWFPFNVPGGWAFSGRVALYNGVTRLGLPPHSTILVPAYHEGIELDALLAAGYRVRYYRVDQDLRIDFADIERRIDPSVSALYVIHYFGMPQPLAALRAFCDARGLRLIEDCALALFSQVDGTWLGSVGDLAIFSLYKTLPLPHGGYVVSRAPAQPQALRAPPFMSTVVQTLDLVHHTLQAGGWEGIERAATRASRFVRRLLRWDRGTTVSSGGPRWDPRQVSYGASRWTQQLVRFTNPDQVIARRRANYARLAGQLRPYVSVPFPELAPGTCPLLLPVLVANRDHVHAELAALGVQSGKYWPVSHSTCPADVAADVAPWREHCLELPIHQELSAADIDRVAAAVVQVLLPREHGQH